MVDFPLDVKSAGDLQFGLEKIVEDYLRSSHSHDDPYVIHMLGVPGAGKSTVASHLFNAISARSARVPVFVAFDRIMMQIGGYKQESNTVEAFRKFEIPAREAGYHLIKELITRKCDLLLDHGGSMDEHPAFLSFAKEYLCYSVYVIHVLVDLEIAFKRIDSRAKKEGRHTPANYITERNERIDRLVPKYEKLATKFFEITNNSSDALRDLDEVIVPNIAAEILRNRS